MVCSAKATIFDAKASPAASIAIFPLYQEHEPVSLSIDGALNPFP